MKFYNISDIKLRVVLGKDDCVEYGIDVKKSDYTGREIRKTIKDILLKAGAECGFFADEDKILVQLYPLPEGECELLVTRLASPSKKDTATLSSARGVSLLESKRGVYRFASYDEMRSAVTVAYREGAECDIYRDDLGRYYIFITEDICDDISEFEIFVEYGERLGGLPIAVFSEYGTLIAKDNGLDYVLLNKGEKA